MNSTHRRICSSSSFILSAFCIFFGFGFLMTTAGVVVSGRLNQSVKSDLSPKSFSNSS